MPTQREFPCSLIFPIRRCGGPKRHQTPSSLPMAFTLFRQTQFRRQLLLFFPGQFLNLWNAFKDHGRTLPRISPFDNHNSSDFTRKYL